MSDCCYWEVPQLLTLQGLMQVFEKNSIFVCVGGGGGRGGGAMEKKEGYLIGVYHINLLQT